MSLTMIGVLGMIAMLFLLVLGVPISFALAAVGALGLALIAGWQAAFSQISLLAWDKGTEFTIVCIPMFIFMGTMVYHSGIARDLYDFLQKLLGRVPGSLAVVSVAACGAFGAVTGSSVACVATMGAIIMPEMKRYKYDGKLATGVLAASGTLGILIPPSLGFVFYGILTETSIADLFIAGIIPGILTILLYSSIIIVRCKLNPSLAPPGRAYTLKESAQSLKGVFPIVTIFAIVIGGLYTGIFTPTEAAGVGVVGVFIITLLMRRMTWRKFKESADDAGVVSSMIYLLVVGGYLIARFLALTHITTSVIDFVHYQNFSPYVFIFIAVIIYLILGCMLDVFGMLILSIPFFFPIVVSYGLDPVWFGVFVVIMTEIALITPPIGVNVFVIHNVARDVPMASVFYGIIPFLFANLAIVLLITIFPEIATWLPSITPH